MKNRLLERLKRIEDEIKPSNELPLEAVAILVQLGVKAPGDRPQDKARQEKNLRKYAI